jgi:hypothetical protein
MTVLDKEGTAFFNAITTALMVLTTASIDDEQFNGDWWEQYCKEEPGCAECKCFDL